MPQGPDYRTAIITGTTGGVTGGDIMPPDLEGVIHDISYAELGTLGGGGPGVTGSRVAVTVQPSGTNIDVKTLGSNASLVYGEARDASFGTIPRGGVLQVTTSVGNVVARIVYTIEESRFA